MRSSHTKGPWVFTPEGRVMQAGTFGTIFEPGALVPESEARENARLASCALDLFEAAAAAEVVLSRGGWIEDSADPEAVALRKLRTATLKAKGA